MSIAASPSRASVVMSVGLSEASLPAQAAQAIIYCKKDGLSLQDLKGMDRDDLAAPWAVDAALCPEDDDPVGMSGPPSISSSNAQTPHGSITSNVVGSRSPPSHGKFSRTHGRQARLPSLCLDSKLRALACHAAGGCPNKVSIRCIHLARNACSIEAFPTEAGASPNSHATMHKKSHC
ncbi:hypothetical protein NDU88_003064 [Pleurodeles waltl]|uniref:Uncharacterized protein n=1 Tax=Pleurodeles waltl TaxID=8319 RepID=A0AAV7M9Z5_PLEWA|nr:hypothetical protein NDU88_003064 [Pleurodeles waltl]